MRLRRRSGRGFSLIEVLLALTLTLALSASIYGFLFELLGRRARLLDAATTTGAVSTVFDRLQRELTFAVVDGPSGPGIDGAAERLRVTSRAVLPIGPSGGARHAGDLVTTELVFDRDRRELLGRSWPTLGDDSGEPAVIAEGVDDVRFRFHDGRAWRDGFDSRSAGSLPALVELSIWLGVPSAVAVDGDEGVDGIGGLGDDGRADDGFDDLFNAGARSAGLSADALLEDRDLGPPTRSRVFAIPDADPVETPAGGEGGGP